MCEEDKYYMCELFETHIDMLCIHVMNSNLFACS